MFFETLIHFQPLPCDESEFCKRLKDEWIDYDKLKSENLTFELSQVAYWGKCHVKQVAGTCVDKTLVFTCNEDGLYNNDREVDEENNQKVSLSRTHCISIRLSI